MLKKTLLMTATITVFGLMGNASAASLTAPTACQKSELHCYFNHRGVLITKSAQAGNELEVMEDAAQRYERHFGVAPNPGIVISGDAIEAVDLAELIRKDGYQAVIPWISNADKLRLAEYNIRSQIREQVPDISEERLERSVKASLASMTAQQGDSNQETEDGALAHELSHMWFISQYWPEDFAPGNTPATYGGPGADWLDEMAAVLSENDYLTKRRWKHFSEIAVFDNINGFYPLTDFFTMAHPMAQKREPRADAADDSIEIQVKVMTRDEIANMEGRDPTIFYTQSRVFADFMIETSGNERIFADITTHLIANGSMETWLNEEGKKQSLPTSVTQLNNIWQDWLKKRHRPN